MRTIITVTKAELSSKSPVESKIKEMSQNFTDLGDAYSFSPRRGMLFELLKLLRSHDVSYGTQFNFGDVDKN